MLSTLASVRSPRFQARCHKDQCNSETKRRVTLDSWACYQEALLHHETCFPNEIHVQGKPHRDHPARTASFFSAVSSSEWRRRTTVKRRSLALHCHLYKACFRHASKEWPYYFLRTVSYPKAHVNLFQVFFLNGLRAREFRCFSTIKANLGTATATSHFFFLLERMRNFDECYCKLHTGNIIFHLNGANVSWHACHHHNVTANLQIQLLVTSEKHSEDQFSF